MRETVTNDEIEIDLMELFFVLLRKWWLIAISAVLVGAAGYLVSTYLIADTYQSTTEIYVLNTQSDKVQYSDIQMSTSLTSDYAHLITTRDVLEQVIGNLELEESYAGLVSRVSVGNPSGTRIVSITVTDRDPYMAQRIANEIREEASEHIRTVMALDLVNVASVANFPEKPSGPNVRNYTLIGLLIGAFLCAGVILLQYLVDDSVKTAEDVERFLGLSTLGTIPVKDEEAAKKHAKKRAQNGSGARRTGRSGSSSEWDEGSTKRDNRDRIVNLDGENEQKDDVRGAE